MHSIAIAIAIAIENKHDKIVSTTRSARRSAPPRVLGRRG